MGTDKKSGRIAVTAHFKRAGEMTKEATGEQTIEVLPFEAAHGNVSVTLGRKVYPMTLAVYVDWETRSTCDIKTAGAHKYAAHPSTEALCLGWALDDDPVNITSFFRPVESGLFPYKWKFKTTDDLKPLFAAIREGALVYAHNSSFDRWIWEFIAETGKVPGFCDGFPHVRFQQWRCSSALACNFGIPRSLADAGEFLGLEKQKLPPRPVKALSMPLRKWVKTGKGPKYDERPELYDELYTYCARDVEACREIVKKCPTFAELDLRVWTADQRINERGIPVDLSLAQACYELHQRNASAADKALEVATKGALKSTRGRDKMLKWLRSNGLVIGNLQAETVRDLLAQESLDPKIRLVLELRVDGAGAASSKYKAILSAASDDNRIRGSFLYNGCRTGRWSARLIQPHNLIRPPKTFTGDGKEGLIDLLADEMSAGNVELAQVFGSSREVLAAMLRPTFCASEGNIFMALDFGQIEARKTAWFAGEKELLRMFAQGVDVYMDMARKIDPRNPNRQLGKAAVLGLGFGMWVDAFINTCRSWGIDADPRTIEKAVHVFREAYPGIPKLWNNLAFAAQEAITTPGLSVPTNRLKFMYFADAKILVLTLPSGRRMFYHRAELEDDGIRYWARTGTDNNGKVGWVRGWGARLTENAVQASAACLLREAIVRLEDQLPEAPVVFHAHDEIVVECRNQDSERLFDEFSRIVTQSPAWATGLPIAADGWRGRRYKK